MNARNNNQPEAMPRRGVTMLELLVVVLIISILAVMAVGVYDTQIRRARYSVARGEIREIENACFRYEVDLGEYPPSSSGFLGSSGVIQQASPYFGNGFLYMALQRSMSNNPLYPAAPRWQGPYLNIADRKVHLIGVPAFEGAGGRQPMVVDPWGSPYYYCRSSHLTPEGPIDYVDFKGTQYPGSHPWAQHETYFNPRTVQIFSLGANATTLELPYRGLDTDDLSNFEGRSITEESSFL